MEKRASRKTGPELLRIVAMAMIVTLHYLDKGGILPAWKGEQILTLPEGEALWLEALCQPAVNAFVLLTGYFGLTFGKKYYSRLFGLWGMTLFYSLAIGLPGLFLTGTADLYSLLECLLPVLTNRYWFITAYLLLMLIAPFLEEGIMVLSRRDYRFLLGIMLVLFCGAKSLLPILRLPLDDQGYSVLWFLVLYLLGRYFGRFGLPFGRGKLLPFLFWLGAGSSTLLLTIIFRGVALSTGRLAEVTDYAYCYNHLFCLLSSVGLLTFFVRLELSPAMLRRAVIHIAPLTLGVYLIHEHPLLRYRWPEWFHTQSFAENPLWPLHWLVTVTVVYGFCLALEYVRRRVTLLLRALLFKEKGN